MGLQPASLSRIIGSHAPYQVRTILAACAIDLRDITLGNRFGGCTILSRRLPSRILEPRYNVCPTDPVDVVLPGEGKRHFEQMRWGLVPYWWSKPLKELRLATFNARVETVETKPFFREPFKKRRCLMPVSGYYEWQATPAWQATTLLYCARRFAGFNNRRAFGSMEGSRQPRPADPFVLHDYYGAQRLRCRGA